MEVQQRFKIRCMNPDEVDRVSELVRALQSHQKMKVISRLPTSQDIEQDLTHKMVSGNRVSSNLGTFTVVAIDNLKSSTTKSHIVGYLIYTQAFCIKYGRHIYMNSFFIEEQYRRHGLGRKIMQYMLLHAKATGNAVIDVPVMNDNPIGQRFYASYGSYLVSDEYIVYSKALAD